jgi:hypothetical protein
MAADQRVCAEDKLRGDNQYVVKNVSKTDRNVVKAVKRPIGRPKFREGCGKNDQDFAKFEWTVEFERSIMQYLVMSWQIIS